MKPLSYTERAQFLAAVHDMGQGAEIQDAALRLLVEFEAESPAPWADTDPFAAERYLAGRGAALEVAAANAAEFELHTRALYALTTGKPAQTFQELADWIKTHVDGVQ